MMMFSIFGLLILLGGGAALVALGVFAIVTKKLWIIPAAVGFVFLGLIASGLLGALYFTAHRAPMQIASAPDFIQQVNTNTQFVAQGPPNFNAHVSRPNWSSIFVVIILLAFGFGLVIRRVTSPVCGHGLRRAWPVVAAGLIMAFLLLIGARTQYSVSQANSAAAAASRQVAEAILDQKRAIVEARQIASNQAQKHRQLVQLDIREEMDQFDAPRIQLTPNQNQPEAPDAPPVPVAPVAPPQPVAVAKLSDKPIAGGDKSATKTTKQSTKKSVAATSPKRKRSEKPSADGDSKQLSLIAISTGAEATAAKKEKAPASAEPVAIAEAEPDKPTARPAWVDEAPKRTGNTRREVIATELYESPDECYQAADIYLMLKTHQRLQELVGQPYADRPLPSLTFQNGQILAGGQLISFGNGNAHWTDDRLRTLTNMGIGPEYIRREIVAKDPANNESREFLETVQRSFGPMKKLYLQIEFTSAIENELRRHWDAYQRRERFAIAGVSAGSVVGFLGMIFGLLKIDTWTKGYYTKRLFIGVPAAIIVVSMLLWADPLNMF